MKRRISVMVIGLLLICVSTAHAVLIPPASPQNVQPPGFVQELRRATQGFYAPGDVSHNGVICRNDPVSNVDPLGLYGAQGHYYTTYVVAKAAGLTVTEAMKLAFYAQLPDEIESYNAMPEHHVQELHALGNTPVVTRRNAISSLLASSSLSLEAKGVLIHTLGDTYSHSFPNQESSGKRLPYPKPLGHLSDWKRPDSIGADLEIYQAYVYDLYYQIRQMFPDRQTKPELVRRLVNETTSYSTFADTRPWRQKYRSPDITGEGQALREFSIAHAELPIGSFAPELSHPTLSSIPAGGVTVGEAYSTLSLDIILNIVELLRMTEGRP